MKTQFVMLRMNSQDVDSLKELAIQKQVSVSHLIREATCKKYKLKGEKIKQFVYNKGLQPGRPRKLWSDQEVAILVKLYQPSKKGCKKNIADKLGRSYWSVKHKVHSLQLNGMV